MNSKIIEYLRKAGYNPYNDFYPIIETWLNLWKGKTDFHKYQVVYDDKTYEREMYSLGMPKRIAEDWASICWSEKDTIKTSSKNQKYLDNKLQEIKFNKQLVLAIEKSAYSGTCGAVLRVKNIKKFGVPVVVTLNSFITDTEAEYQFIKEHCEALGCEFALSSVWAKGGEGGLELAGKVLDTLENKNADFKPIYKDEASLKDKIETVAKEIYGAASVSYSDAASKELKHIEEMGFGNLPVCMAKTQYSLSDNPALLGRPEGFDLNVRDVYVNAGAGFVVVLTGKILTMPGLPKSPAAERIDYDEEAY